MHFSVALTFASLMGLSFASPILRRQDSSTPFCRPPSMTNVTIIYQQTTDGGWLPAGDVTTAGTAGWSNVTFGTFPDVPPAAAYWDIEEGLQSRGNYSIKSHVSPDLCALSTGGPIQGFSCADTPYESIDWFIRCLSCSATSSTGCRIESAYQAGCVSVNWALNELLPADCGDRTFSDGQTFNISV